MNPPFAWISRLLPRSLRLRLSLLVIALIVVLVSLIGALSSDSIPDILTHQIGRKTLIWLGPWRSTRRSGRGSWRLTARES